MIMMGFCEIVWWLEEQYNWDFVKVENKNRVRFDWENSSFWINSDLKGEGDYPFGLKNKLKEKNLI